MKKVFLGGTCNGSTWREELIKLLEIDYFNPVVDDWTEESYQEELRQRELCDYCLYVITPKMKSVYSIGEVIDDSNKRPNKTLFCVLDMEWEHLGGTSYQIHEFNISQLKSLNKLGVIVENNGGKYFKSLEEVAKYLNNTGE